MAKLSVYIPDELWDQAQLAFPDRKASQLIQAALAELLPGNLPSYALQDDDDLEDDLKEERAKLSASLRNAAKAAFARGYKRGLEIARSLDWDEFDRAAALNFDPQRVANEIYQGGVEPGTDDWVTDYANAGRAFREGLVRAFRDLWDAITTTDEPAH